MTLTISRESELIFTAKSDVGYWSDGSPIDSRLALGANGRLSSIRAQAIDARAGNRYLLVTPFSIGNPDLVARASQLAIGESFTHQR